MKKQNLQSQPPKINSELNAFIEGANVDNLTSLNSTKSNNQVVNHRSINLQEIEIFPWEEERVRADLNRHFNLRLSEPVLLKLQYIQKKTNKSMHKFCLEHLIPAIEAEINVIKNWQ